MCIRWLSVLGLCLISKAQPVQQETEIKLNFSIVLEKEERIKLTLDDLTQPFQTKKKLNPRLDDTTLSQYLDVIKQPFSYGEQLIEDSPVANTMPLNIRYGNSTKCKTSSSNIYFETMVVCNNDFLIYQNQIGEYKTYDLRAFFKLHADSEINEAQILLDDRMRVLLTVSHPEDFNKTTIHYMEESIKAPFNQNRITFSQIANPTLVTRSDERFKFIPLQSDIDRIYIVNKRLNLGYFWNGSSLTELKPYNFESNSLVKAFELNLTYQSPVDHQNQTINSVFAVQGQGQSVNIFYCLIEQTSFKCYKKSEGALSFQIGDYLKFDSRRSMFIRQEYRDSQVLTSVKAFNTLSHLNDRLELPQIREIFLATLTKRSFPNFKPEMEFRENEELLVLTYPIVNDGIGATRAIHIKDAKTGAYYTNVTQFWTFSLLGRKVRLFYKNGFFLIDSVSGLLSIYKKKNSQNTFPLKISHGPQNTANDKVVNNLKISFSQNIFDVINFDLPGEITLFADMEQEITFFESEIVGNDIDVFRPSAFGSPDTEEHNFVNYDYFDREPFKFCYKNEHLNISEASKIIVSNEYGFAIQTVSRVKYYFKCKDDEIQICVACQKYISFTLPEGYIIAAFETFRDFSNFFAIGRLPSNSSLVFVSIYVTGGDSSDKHDSTSTLLYVAKPSLDFTIYDVEDLEDDNQSSRSVKIVLLYTINNDDTLSYWRVDLSNLTSSKELVFSFSQISQRNTVNFCPKSLFYSHMSGYLFVTSSCMFKEELFEKFRVYTFDLMDTVGPVVLQGSKESDLKIPAGFDANREFCIFENKVFMVTSNRHNGFHLYRGFDHIESTKSVREVLPMYDSKASLLLGYKCMSNEKLLITIMGNSTLHGSDVLIYVYDMKKTLDSNTRLIKMIQGYTHQKLDFFIIHNNELLVVDYAPKQVKVTLYELRKYSMKVYMQKTNHSDLKLEVHVKNSWLSSFSMTKILADPEIGYTNFSIKSNSSCLKTNTIYPIEDFFKYEGTIEDQIQFIEPAGSENETANTTVHDLRFRLITSKEVPTQTHSRKISSIDWVQKHNETSLIAISYIQESTNFIIFNDALSNKSSTSEIHLFQTRQSCEIPKLITIKFKSTSYSIFFSNCLRSYLRELKMLIFAESNEKKEKNHMILSKDIFIGDFDDFHAVYGNKDDTILVTIFSTKKSKVYFFTLDLDVSENLSNSAFEIELLYELYDSRQFSHNSLCLYRSRSGRQLPFHIFPSDEQIHSDFIHFQKRTIM